MAITIVAIIMSVYGLLGLILWQKELFTPYLLNPFIWLIIAIFDPFMFGFIVYPIAGPFILIRKNWARKFAVISSTVLLLLHLPGVIEGLVTPVTLDPGNFWVTNPPPLGLDSTEMTSFYLFPFIEAIQYIPPLMYCFFILFLRRAGVKRQFK